MGLGHLWHQPNLTQGLLFLSWVDGSDGTKDLIFFRTDYAGKQKTKNNNMSCVEFKFKKF